MTQALLLLAVLAAALGGWLVATWLAADDHPIFAPNKPGRVTFKAVLQNALRDLSDITRPARSAALRIWRFWGPRVTNRALYVAVLADLTVLFGNNGAPFEQVLGHPLAFAGLVLVNLLTPLTPPGAPDRIPPPAPAAPLPAQGPGAQAGY